MVFGHDRTISVHCFIGGGLASWKGGLPPYDFLIFFLTYGTMNNSFGQIPIGFGISVFRYFGIWVFRYFQLFEGGLAILKGGLTPNNF